jgi:leader peptidase (prepilin peptidase) / N-methyltransferase
LFQAILSAWLGIVLLDLVRVLGSLAFRQEAMGAGDPHMAAMMGAWLGWQQLLVALFLSFGTGAAIGLTLLGIQRLGKRQEMKFGPFLAIGSLMTVFWGPGLLGAYQRLFFL